MRKELDKNKVKEIIEKLSIIFNIIDLKFDDLKKATILNIEDYEDILRVDGAPIEKPVSQNTYICGYEIDIPAGEELILITTLK